MSNDLTSLTTKQLRKAANLKEKIEKLNGELEALLGTPVKVAKRRTMSAATRAKMAAAQSARWARRKAAAKKSK